MHGMGHNGGPELTGLAWRSHCWRAARAALLPVLPIEVVRMRVKRAAELGLDYKTYAGVRAQSGRDVVAFLFSSNALRVDPLARIAPAEAARLIALAGKVDRIGLLQGAAGARLMMANPGALDRGHAAPAPFAPFGRAAQGLRAAMGKLPGDQVVLIGSEAPWEGEWLAAGKLAAMVPASVFFGGAA